MKIVIANFLICKPEEAAMLEEMVEDASKLISDDSSGQGNDAGEDVDKIASDEEEEREEEDIDQEHTEEGKFFFISLVYQNSTLDFSFS